MAIDALKSDRGEFTVVVEIGETTKIQPQEVDLVHEFGEMTTNPSISRRRAVSMLARKHGLAPNSVYEALEDAKKSIK
jgi:16S rRNA C1402 (ribose-2'-O) methylase RsmI